MENGNRISIPIEFRHLKNIICKICSKRTIYTSEESKSYEGVNFCAYCKLCPTCMTKRSTHNKVCMCFKTKTFDYDAVAETMIQHSYDYYSLTSAQSYQDYDKVAALMTQ